MLDSKFRSYFQTIVFDPLANAFTKLGFQPAQLTIGAMIFGLFASCALAAGDRWIALSMLALSGALDVCDGTVARKLRVSSDKGCIIDIIGDRLVEAFIVLGLYLYDPETRGWPALLLLATFYLCITTFLLSGIFEKNYSQKSFHYSSGIIERGETFVFFFFVIIFDDSFTIAATLFAGLVGLTALIRFLELLKLSSRSECEPKSRPNLDARHQATMLTVDQLEKQ